MAPSKTSALIDLGPNFPTMEKGMRFKATKDGILYIGFNRLRFERVGYEIIDDKNFRCQYCQKVFTGEMYTKNHVQAHMSFFRLRCIFCGKGFAQLHTLKKHCTCCPKITPQSMNYLLDKLTNKNIITAKYGKLVSKVMLVQKCNNEPKKIRCVRKIIVEPEPMITETSNEPTLTYDEEVKNAIEALLYILNDDT